jgi:uncharacterized tellurite resistance protein B-like protein
MVALATNEAKRGVVVQRSAREVQDLFALRYREACGEGLLLEANARPMTIDYHAASATLAQLGKRISVKLPDVTGRRGQLGKIVGIWNACVDDLKRANTAKKKSRGELTAAAWAALPPDLRAQYDHPDLERWDRLLERAEPIGRFSVTTVAQVAATGNAGNGRLTPAQLRKLGETATLLGIAVEPELRFARTARDGECPLVIWRAESTELSNHEIYLAASSVLALAMSIVHADGAPMDDDELRVMTRIIEDLFRLDDALRTRLSAHIEWLRRQPANALALARKLQASLKPEDLVRLGRLLVAVAAADGTVSRAEHDALKRLYKALGLQSGQLAEALIASEARRETDEPVIMQRGTPGAPGERIPPPPDAPAAPQLNQRAIEAILADTRDVAAMLSAVLDSGDDEPAPPPAPVVSANGLDARYQTVLQQLLAKPQWTVLEIRNLSLQAQLMPGAILETINGWSDATFGDYLIDDRGDWHIHVELLGRANA